MSRTLHVTWYGMLLSIAIMAIARPAPAAELTAGNSGVGTSVYPPYDNTSLNCLKTLDLGGNSWDSYGAMAVDPAGAYAYVYTDPRVYSGDHPVISKIRLSDMTVAATVAPNYLGTGTISVMDPTGAYAYFAGTVGIVKIRLSDFTQTGYLTLTTAELPAGVAIIDSTGSYAYFGSNTNPGKVVKVRLSDMTKAGSLTLGIGETAICAAVIDPTNTYGYFGNNVNTDHGIIAKVRLLDMVEVASLPLASGEAGHCTAVIDSSGTYAYFGTNTVPSKVVKIRLSDFTEVGSLALAAGETQLHSSVIDPQSRYAYFGTWTAPGRIVKVRLSDFLEVGSLILDPNTKWVKKAGIDPAGNFAYFDIHASTGNGMVVKVSLIDSTASTGNSNAIRATKTTMPQSGNIQEVRFYAHQAGGRLRLSIYGENASAENLLWQSAEMAITSSSAWITAPIAAGTPASLTLNGGNYWLAFNTDATTNVASYTAGKAGDGFWKRQPLATFPGVLNINSIEYVTDRWSEYLTYTPVPPRVPAGTWPDSIALNSINWKWLDNSDNETGFKLFADAGLTTPTTLQTTTAANATSWTMNGLMANSPYSCRVAAINNLGEATETTYLSAWTGIDPVSSLVFSNVGTQSIDVAALNNSFANLTGGVSGLLFGNITAGTSAAAWQQNNTPWSSKSLTPNTYYQFSGKSRNGVAIETALTKVTKCTLATKPTLGYNVNCNSSINSWHIPGQSFTFSNPAGFGLGTHGGSSYKVYGYAYRWDASPTTATFTSTGTAWMAGTLNLSSNGSGAYYLHLQSLNGEGVLNPEMLDLGPYFIDGDSPTAPGTPTAPAVVANSNLVTFTWGAASDAGSGVASYTCQIGTAPGASDIFNGNVTGTLSKTIAANYGCQAYCRVRAVDAVGNAGPWSANSAAAFIDAPPAAPVIFSLLPPVPRKLDDVTAITTATDADPGDSVTGFRYEWRLAGVLKSTSTTLASAFLVKGQPWTLSVWAQDTYGGWSQATVLPFTIANTPPSQPIVEIRPKPVTAGQSLIVDVQEYSTDPDGDVVAYDFNWYKSRDGGKAWIHKIELDGSPQVVGEFIQDGDLWEVRYIPYEKNSVGKPAAQAQKTSAPGKPLAAARIEGQYGWDRVYVGGNDAPKMSLATPLAQLQPGGPLLIVGWDFSDAAGDGCTVDLEWKNAMQLNYTPFAAGLPARQGAFRGAVAAMSLDQPVTIHGVIHNPKGATAQEISAPVTLLPPAPPLVIDYLLGRSSDALGMDANGDGAIDAADLVRVVARQIPDPPLGPRPANAASGVAVTPTLQWSACRNAQSYQLYLWPANTARPATPAASGLTVNAYAVKSALAGATTYWWQVVAINAATPMPGPVWSFTTK